MSSPTEVIRAAALVCDDLDQRLYPYVGVLRQALRLAATAPAAPGPDHCPICGSPVVQPRHGRTRKYCSDKCRSRARNVREMVR